MGLDQPNEQLKSVQSRNDQEGGLAEFVRSYGHPAESTLAIRKQLATSTPLQSADTTETAWSKLTVVAAGAVPLVLAAGMKRAPSPEAAAEVKSVLLDITRLQEAKSGILDASEELARRLIRKLPQKSGDEIRWSFGGSLPPNLLVKADKVTELDEASLPGRVPLRTIEMNPEARRSYLNFSRTMGDVDIVPLRHKSPALFPGERPLWALGFDRLQSIYQLSPETRSILHRQPDAEPTPGHFLVDFLDFPQAREIVSLKLGRQEFFVLDPRALVAAKFVQSLGQFNRGGNAAKFSDDFRNLYDGASALYSRGEVEHSIERAFMTERASNPNGLFLHPHHPEFERDIGPLANRLIAGDANAPWLQKLQLDSSRNIEVLNILGRLGNDADKAAMVKFINAHKAEAEQWIVVDGPETRTAMAQHVLRERPDLIERAGGRWSRSDTVEGLSEHIIGRSVLHANIAASMKTPLPMRPFSSDFMALMMHVDPSRVSTELASIDRELKVLTPTELYLRNRFSVLTSE